MTTQTLPAIDHRGPVTGTERALAPDLIQEIKNYAAMAWKRVVFFVEVTVSGDNPTVLADLPGNPPPIRLKVTTLTGDDTVRFGQDRLARHSAVGNYPMMTDDTLRRTNFAPLSKT